VTHGDERPADATAPGDEPGAPTEYGDAACWANRVCQQCGRLNDTEHPVICENCGAHFE
jgi:hypothetical protein